MHALFIFDPRTGQWALDKESTDADALRKIALEWRRAGMRCEIRENIGGRWVRIAQQNPKR